MGTQLVWLKRDLRLADHPPLSEAAKCGPCIVLFIYEPELLGQREFDVSHLAFGNACLQELDIALRARGSMLVYRHGEASAVLDALHAEHPFEAIWSHEETGNHLTYQRDRRVARWARVRGVAWHEFPQTGVVRRLRDRDGWSRQWMQRMNSSLAPAPGEIVAAPGVASEFLRDASALGLAPSPKSNLQPGGEQAAHAVLHSFLHVRGAHYRTDMSSPVTAWEGCSRLSPYLAFGAISMRSVHQALNARCIELRELRKATPGSVSGPWLGSLSAFGGRLHWHCHFMQKLEDEPRIEFENMARCYDGLREDEWDQARFDAWCAGQTGYPMVDACMRALHARSWINFRMRAMLMSFAAYDLWLHWREPAIFLARHFLDFEAGIHFSQAQMQSGTTGINTMRIYSPAKQVRDQDPDGVFVRQWVPELAAVPTEYLAEPHTMPLSVQDAAGCRIGRDYPAPIVDHADAVKRSRQRMAAVRRTAPAREEAQAILTRHGSRRRPGPRRG